jgi:sRNA-binding regulator protein Hfq
VPLTFDARDVDLRSAPHIDAMVINCSVVGSDLHKVLVDNGSQADIIFLHAFDRMGISHSLLKPSDNHPLYGFGGKGTFPVGKIELPLSFDAAPNARSEQVTFDIVDMVYPYNTIMGRGSINKFEAAIHGLYLCMKIPGPQGAITVYGNQQAARNIERDFVPGQRNVHCLTTQREVPEATRPTANKHEKAQLQSNDGTKTVPLDQAMPKQTVIISEDLTSHDEERLAFCRSRRWTPHIDAMVINCSVAGWDLHKVLVDNGSQADIIFLHAFDRMGINHSLIKPSDNPLYGFGGKGTFPVGKIELPLSFGAAPNARSEQVTFDIVDMVYPYNAIMGWGSINKFEAAIHGLYLCMKIPGPQGAITVYGNQQATRNIERDFVPGQRNVHCLTVQREVPEATHPTANKHEKA